MTIASAWSGHDCSFCFLDDEGKPVVHAEYERYIREKEPDGDALQFFKERFPEEFNNIKYFASCFPVNKLEKHTKSFEDLKEVIEKNEGQIYFIGHHRAHAANAFFSSNFEKSIILTIDGGGVETQSNDVTSFGIWQGEGNRVEPLGIFPIHQVNVG